MTELQRTEKWLFPMYDKNKDPEPLFVLDLILKPNQLIPTYSTSPEDVVTKMLDVFDEGIDILKKIPQLEPILMKHLFKTHGQQHLKAPVRPMQKPAPPDPNKKSVLPDENTWLWEAFAVLKEALTEAVQPLYEYVETFSQFKEENELNPDRYVKMLDEGEGDDKAEPEGLRADIFRLRGLVEELKVKIPQSVTCSIF